MNRLLLPLAIALALAACNKPAEPAAPAAEPVAATTDAAAPAETPAPAAPDAAAPAADEGDPAQVDQAVINTLGGDPAVYRKMFDDLQKGVAAKDANAVAALVHYPIGVDIAGKNTVIKDAAGFARDYDKFMTPEIAKAIVDTRYGDVMVNDQGMMLGQGEAWINGICKDDACKDVDVQVVTIQAKSDLSP